MTCNVLMRTLNPTHSLTHLYDISCTAYLLIGGDAAPRDCRHVSPLGGRQHQRRLVPITGLLRLRLLLLLLLLMFGSAGEELFDALISGGRTERLGRRLFLVGPLVALSVAVFPRRAVDVRGLEIAVGVVLVHLHGVRVGRTLHDRLVGHDAVLYRFDHPTNRHHNRVGYNFYD